MQNKNYQLNKIKIVSNTLYFYFIFCVYFFIKCVINVAYINFFYHNQRIQIHKYILFISTQPNCIVQAFILKGFSKILNQRALENFYQKYTFLSKEKLLFSEHNIYNIIMKRI